MTKCVQRHAGPNQFGRGKPIRSSLPLTPTPRRSGAGSTLYLHGKTRMQNSFFVLNTYHNCYTSSKRSLGIENLTSGMIFSPFPIIYSIHACPPFRTPHPQQQVPRSGLEESASLSFPLYVSRYICTSHMRCLSDNETRRNAGERWERETPTQTWITFDTLDIVSRKLIRERRRKKGRGWSLLAIVSERGQR